MLARLVALVAPPRCLVCGAAVAVRVRLCGGCRGELTWLGPTAPAGVWAPVAFDGPARALVHALKFRGRTAAAGEMAAQIAANAPSGLLAGAVLVPVPAHPARARARGFDQALLVARRLGARTDLPVREVLARRPAGTGPQVGAGRGTRLARDLGITARRHVPGPVVLVDDVVTTGATIAACRRALLAAGVLEVRAVAYARTLG